MTILRVEADYFAQKPLTWPGARFTRRLFGDLRHSADLALFAVDGGRRWSDALLAETRFHLFAMLNALEIAIKVEVVDSDVLPILNRIEEGYCRSAIEANLELLNPDLLAHLRIRAALALITRHSPGPAGHLRENIDAAREENRFLRAHLALGMAEARWREPQYLDAPMRPDLPAEPYCDLAWTAAALLIHGCEQQAGTPQPILMRVIGQAAEQVIARHDEGQGVFALAQRCARQLESHERQQIAPAAMVEGRLLLFCGLVEAETGLSLDVVLAAFIDGGDDARCAMMRFMGLDESIVFRVGELLGPVFPERTDDDSLAALIERYRACTADKAENWLARLSGPVPLTARLAMLDRLR